MGEYYPTKHNLLTVFVAGGRSWKADPGEAVVTFMLTVLQPKALREEVR